jgi:hypothetical protein
MPQISIFASLNHIHHHTYFKNPYVHIQVFHILHHHTIKLLQAFKSFLTRESIIENQQRKLVRCWPHNSAMKLIRYRPFDFNSKSQFCCSRQRMLIRCRTTQLQQRILIRCSQHTLGTECSLHTT